MVFFSVLNLSLVSLFHLVLLLALSLAQLVDTAGENSLREHCLMEERWRRGGREEGEIGSGRKVEEGRNGETKRGRRREEVEKRKEWEEIDGGERRDRLSLHVHM